MVSQSPAVLVTVRDMRVGTRSRVRNQIPSVVGTIPRERGTRHNLPHAVGIPELRVVEDVATSTGKRTAVRPIGPWSGQLDGAPSGDAYGGHRAKGAAQVGASWSPPVMGAGQAQIPDKSESRDGRASRCN
jgi:hypothetical protein